MVMKQNRQVNMVIFQTVKKQKILSAGIFCAVVGAVVAALIPPLILAKMIDTITDGKTADFGISYYTLSCFGSPGAWNLQGKVC